MFSSQGLSSMLVVLQGSSDRDEVFEGAAERWSDYT